MLILVLAVLYGLYLYYFRHQIKAQFQIYVYGIGFVLGLFLLLSYWWLIILGVVIYCVYVTMKEKKQQSEVSVEDEVVEAEAYDVE